MIRREKCKIYPIWTYVRNNLDSPDLPIGSAFEFEGTLLCVKDAGEDVAPMDACKMCYFNNSGKCGLTPVCNARFRIDSKNAYFEKI